MEELVDSPIAPESFAGAEVVYSPEMRLPKAEDHQPHGNWFRQFYDARLRWFTESYLADLYFAVLVLFGVAVFEGFSRGLQYWGFSHERAQMFEEIEFYIASGVMVIMGLSFIIKLAIAVSRQK